MNDANDIFAGAEVIHSYSRAEGIADGLLVDLSKAAPDVCAQHFKYPIACTAAVWAIIDKAVKNPRWMNDINGVVHDILGMSKALGRKLSPTTVIFSVIIRGAGRVSRFQFKMVCGPGDQAEPVLTIMLPEED